MSQALQALELANETRYARADLKRCIAQGEVTVAEVLVDIPPLAAKMSIGDLLRAQTRWGSHTSGRLLGRAGVRENRRLCDLTERQRDLIVGLL
jgi:hypothetical protein